jgi:hypothetical protein
MGHVTRLIPRPLQGIRCGIIWSLENIELYRDSGIQLRNPTCIGKKTLLDDDLTWHDKKGGHKRGRNFRGE